MTTKQKAASLIVRLVLEVGLLWGAWYECGPFTWTILCLVTAGLELRILHGWLDRKNNELAAAAGITRQTLLELRRRADQHPATFTPRKGTFDDRE